MANEKKPSIYYDRSTIGSQDELDEYGVWVKSEPQDLSSAGVQAAAEPVDFGLPEMEELPDMEKDDLALSGSVDDISFDIPEPEEAGAPESGVLQDDLNLPDFEEDESFESSALAGEDDAFNDVSMDDFPGSAGEGGSLGITEELTEEADIDDEGLNLDIDFNELEDPSPASGMEDVEFDDIAAVGKELQEPSPGQKAGGVDLSTQLLMKIANELSSIKSELSSLKSELAAHTGGEGAESKGSAKNDGGGFFDEEDDEKIALTGDELNNILNTADFTEEAGQDATSGDAEEIKPDLSPEPAAEDVTADFLSEGDILGGSPDMDQGLALRDDEILADDANPSPSGEVLPDEGVFEEKDHEVLKELRESGVQPMTAAPDDTKYLEEETEGFDIDLDESLLNEEGAEVPAFADMEPESAGAPDLDELDLESAEVPVLDELELESPEGPAPGDLDLESAGAPAFDGLDIESPEAPGPGELESAEVPGLDDLDLESPGEDLDELDLSVPGEEPVLDELGIDLEEVPAGSEESEDLAEEELELDLGPGFEEDALPLENAEEQKDEELFAEDLPDGFVVEADETQGPLPEETAEDLAPSGDFSPLDDEPLIDDFSGAVEEPLLPQDTAAVPDSDTGLPPNLQEELKTVLSYMDQLLESLPEDKIEEFAKSEYYETYKKLFEELGLV